MTSLLDRARHLVRLAASSTSEEEARTSGRQACRLIVENRFRLSTEERPDDDATLEELTESARVALDKLQKKRKELEVPTPAVKDAPAPEVSIKEFLKLGKDGIVVRCKVLRCRGNKPCDTCRGFVARRLAHAIETELGRTWPEAFQSRFLQMLTGYLELAYENVLALGKPKRRGSKTEERAKKEPPKLRRHRRGLEVIDGGKTS